MQGVGFTRVSTRRRCCYRLIFSARIGFAQVHRGPVLP